MEIFSLNSYLLLYRRTILVMSSYIVTMNSGIWNSPKLPHQNIQLEGEQTEMKICQEKD